ncbi:MAG TPA: hypothetical protein PLL54_01940 [Dermatophilaceae bacterium]|nr:hypothetical protein [Dermatophilaceae bacterium]
MPHTLAAHTLAAHPVALALASPLRMPRVEPDVADSAGVGSMWLHSRALDGRLGR